MELVVKSAPDGYTLCLCGAGLLISSTLMAAKPPYDAHRDIAPVSLVASAPYLLLVRNAPGLNSVQDLLTQARQNPGKLNYGSAGSGSTAQLAAALFASMANINVVHVPYKGSAPAATDLFGGQIQFLSHRRRHAIRQNRPPARAGSINTQTLATASRFAHHPRTRRDGLRNHHLARARRATRHPACHRLPVEQRSHRIHSSARSARAPGRRRRGTTQHHASANGRIHQPGVSTVGKTADPVGVAW